ncbi:HXXEE domain-containing protein [Clostridium beijerinckii]|uniref:HXXEE domain-containing protein n=1 Tax=Clostridium beijerinckii TaxID=1520 RepID=A0A9Q5GQJ1_CLOBE|nr:HXXEE domain-containing protein [Clostridium beijerinckii]AQS05117.1 hypothetical protein CLBIJ_25480 [Clostridium beijerinckii]MBA2888568.1 hypothetical protein [Clostridium beijerinckii]MBA2902977.1 hypothetical protein [Clostridium beijerinckii]MBA2913181.1 hypothetical protein [Clostridium beijerinckii]MBA9015312.1 hypothetical protein [Clostridium beijerinckii]
MSNMQAIIWFFPIVFIIHDFEEIIFIQSWINKNRYYLSEKFPKLSKNLFPHFDNITAASFAFGVAEEFILIIIITIISYKTNWFNLWIGLFIAFTTHLIIHCFQALIIRKYVPAIVTSIIFLPICINIIKSIAKVYTSNIIISYSVLGFIIMLVNLYIAHKCMDLFSEQLLMYKH